MHNVTTKSIISLSLSLSLSLPLSPSIPSQAFCSSITGTLATMAVLKGVGVGDSSATPLAATLTWMLKGMIAAAPVLMN